MPHNQPHTPLDSLQEGQQPSSAPPSLSLLQEDETLKEEDVSTVNVSMHEPDLQLLRALVFKRELAVLENLEKRLTDPLLHAEDVSRIIAEALVLRAKKDDNLSLALQPSVESIFRSAIKRHPVELATGIFPLMGPAIRKAIAESFNSMLQGFSKTIGQVFSWRGLRWRFQALRSGQSFSDIVLLHTLEYKVEEVFLIHSHTGLMVGHSKIEEVESNDAELVSSMLTAIQDFVQDCFKVDEGEALDTLQMGSRMLMVEKGSQVSLALLIRGTLPLDFKNKIRDVLDLIHIAMAKELEEFSGDIAPFTRIQHYLDDCLVVRYVDENKHVPFWVKCLPVLGVALLVAVPAFFWYENMRFEQAIQSVNIHPGVIVNRYAGGPFGGWDLYFSKDPLAQDPKVVFKEQGYATNKVTFYEKSFVSLDPEMVSMRLQQAVQPLDTVEITFAEGILSLIGTAPIDWILATKEKASTIPGVNQIDTSKISDPRTARLSALMRTVESFRIEFPFGKEAPEGVEKEKMIQVVDALEELSKLIQHMGLSATLIIYGHTDTVGTDKRNYELSEGRANSLASMMYSRGIAMPIATYGFGSQYVVDDAAAPDTTVAPDATDKVTKVTKAAKAAKAASDAAHKEELHQRSRRIELKVHLNYLSKSIIDLDNI